MSVKHPVAATVAGVDARHDGYGVFVEALVQGIGDFLHDLAVGILRQQAVVALVAPRDFDPVAVASGLNHVLQVAATGHQYQVAIVALGGCGPPVVADFQFSHTLL